MPLDIAPKSGMDCFARYDLLGLGDSNINVLSSETERFSDWVSAVSNSCWGGRRSRWAFMEAHVLLNKCQKSASSEQRTVAGALQDVTALSHSVKSQSIVKLPFHRYQTLLVKDNSSGCELSPMSSFVLKTAIMRI